MRIQRLFVSLALALAACTNAPSGPKGGAALGVVVVASDFKSTEVSLVDPARGVLSQDDCLDSGAVTPTLSMALSGDIVIATATQPNDELLLIDRTNGALDYVAPKSCQVARQLSVSTGFYANPHDVVAISPTKAYVTRFETNQTPSGQPSANDQGDDILIINSTTGAIAGRIDMAPYATTASGATILARPDRALLADGKVYVTLANQSQDFMTTAAARLVVIDPSEDKVVGQLELPNQKGCSGLDFIAATHTLVVGCSGDYNDAANQVVQSAIVLVAVGGSAPGVVKTVTGADTGGRALSSAAFAVAGDNLVIATTPGDFSGTPPDQLWAIAADTGKATKVYDGDGAYVLSSLAWNPATQKIFVTDAGMTTPQVVVIDVSRPDAITQSTTFVANPKSGLPPRLVGWY